MRRGRILSERGRTALAVLAALIVAVALAALNADLPDGPHPQSQEARP